MCRDITPPALVRTAVAAFVARSKTLTRQSYDVRFDGQASLPSRACAGGDDHACPLAVEVAMVSRNPTHIPMNRSIKRSLPAIGLLALAIAGLGIFSWHQQSELMDARFNAMEASLDRSQILLDGQQRNLDEWKGSLKKEAGLIALGQRMESKSAEFTASAEKYNRLMEAYAKAPMEPASEEVIAKANWEKAADDMDRIKRELDLLLVESAAAVSTKDGE